MDSVGNNFLKNKVPAPSEFTGDFYQALKEEVLLVFYKLSQKI
jgi:hypothetical protein